MTFSAGIDFGTTNTTAAITGDGTKPKLIPIEGQDSEIPSAMFFEEKSSGVFFGRDAVTKYTDGEPGRFMRSLKRVLGTDLMKTGTVINGRPVKFQSIIGAFVKNVKDKLDAAAGCDVERVVMGRPVHFQGGDAESDRAAEKELEEIAREAGFKEVLFQFEPVAAAFAHERLLSAERLAAVIDIGGGTSDFTIIKLGGVHAKNMDRCGDILANTGVRVGGNDFDKQLSLAAFMPEFGMGTEFAAGLSDASRTMTVPSAPFFDLSEWSRVDSIYSYQSLNAIRRTYAESQSPEKYARLLEAAERQLGHRLLAAVEDVKIALSSAETTSAPLDFMRAAPEINIERTVFENSIAQQISKIRAAAMECVRAAGVRAMDVELIILTGGSSEIPHVENALCGVFPNAEISGTDKLSSVGLGLAFDALRCFA